MSKRISSCRLFLILLLGGLLLVVGCCLCSTRRAKEEPLPPNVEVIADNRQLCPISRWTEGGNGFACHKGFRRWDRNACRR